MPLPERYARQVPQMTAIWKPEGYFKAQTRIWQAQCEARSERNGAPSAEQLDHIKRALVLNPEDIDALNIAKGHETNKLLRTIQSRLPTDKGNFLHEGNTSSDVLDTSLSLQILESLALIDADFTALGTSLLNTALEHRTTLQVARTHGQHAIPQTFGRQVLGWYEEVERGKERINYAKEVIAVGKLSGEVGTNVFIDPEIEELSLRKLGLQPDAAPTQIISRDRHATVASLMAVNGGTLVRIADNIRYLGSTDVGEVREPFEEDQQGSSAMPHKRNTELTERVVGLGRIIREAAGAELEAQPSLLERDISHSSTERFVWPDLFGTLSYSTKLMTKVVDGLVVNKDQMRENMGKTHGGIYSSRLLNELMAKGIDRTSAYDIMKSLGQKAIDERTNLRYLAEAHPVIYPLFSATEMQEFFSPEYYLRNIDNAFRRAGIDIPPQHGSRRIK